MSLNVLISPDDNSKIIDTINLLKFISTFVQDKATFQLPDQVYTHEQLDDLISWYNSLYNLLSITGNEEDINLEPIVS